MTLPATSTPGATAALMAGRGVEWVVDAFGCDGGRLSDPAVLSALFTEVVRAMGLSPVAPAQWHHFPHPGGITGLLLLAESHLAVHTFPEHGSLCLNVFCCRPRDAWSFEQGLADAVGATQVVVRRLERDYGREQE